MANQTWKAMQVKMDGAAGTIVDITSWTNDASIKAAQDTLEDSGFGMEEKIYKPGMEGSNFSLNGFINSTTEAIFGPLCGNYTSVLKTVGLYDGQKWKIGECYPTDVTITGSVNSLLTWSAGFQVSGAITRTATAPA
jgi:hypothetical protein